MSRRVGASLVGSLLVTCFAAAPTATTGTATAGTTPEAAAEAAGACPGGHVAVVVRGAALCTHGQDVAPTPDTGHAGVGAPEAGAGPRPETVATNRCYGDGVTGPRVQLLYVHRAALNNFARYRPLMRDRAAVIEQIMDASAQQVGAHRHVRFVTNADCTVNVRRVELPSGSIQSGLVSRGFDSPNRKYLVWYEDGVPGFDHWCGGAGTVFYDDRPGPGNYNEHYPGYAVVNSSCLADWFDGQIEAHEVMHTLGSVSDSAPNSTRAGHCRDDHDVMCYEDGGRHLLSPRPCPNEADELRYDCNKNDYFNPNPTGANYLVTHWNTARSRFLTTSPGRAPTIGVPGAPTVTATGGYHSVELAWTPPRSDGGTRITGYRIARDGTEVATVAGSERSFHDGWLTRGQPYAYTVTAMNGVGAGPAAPTVNGTPNGRHAYASVAADEWEVPAGATIHLHVQIQNDGDEPLDDVVVTNSNAPDCDRTVGHLARYDVLEYDCTDVTRTADRDWYTNTVTVTATGMAPVTSDPVEVSVT